MYLVKLEEMTWATTTTVMVTSIYLSPTSPQRVTVTLGGFPSGSTAKNVWRTVDAGINWTDISGNLPKTAVHSVVEHPTNPNFLYLGTDTGIYATTDGIIWSASNDGPALVPVYMLKWYDSSTLLAATFGRGVWRATVGNMAPGAPTGVIATGGNAQATVSFAAPLSDGGNPITGYTVTSNPTGGLDSNAGTTALIHTITGLSNGTAYMFTVKASNAVGEGIASAPSASVTPGGANIAQAISFTNPGAKTLGTAPFALSATGGASGNPVTFTSQTTGVCTVSGSTVTLVAACTCTIAANQAGNASYNAAVQVLQSFTVNSVSSYALSVTKAGTGSGTVTASNINCGSICSVVYVSGTSVTLSATADAGSTFTGWSGAGCSGTGTCTVSMTQAQNVTATFTLATVSTVSPYDGIYQWADGYFLSVHQIGGGVLIGTIYWVYTGNPEQVGARAISEADTFDLFHGQLVGSSATMTGTRFYRACTLEYDFTFNSDASLTVRHNSASNSPGVSVADVDCAARYTPVGSVWTIPRIY